MKVLLYIKYIFILASACSKFHCFFFLCVCVCVCIVRRYLACDNELSIRCNSVQL